MGISVIICTHNPREDYLRRTLDALKTQTLPKVQWELLLIDNASKEPLGKTWDLSWHPNARIIREDQVGLTLARLRGIKESTGELLVFVDDDNVLANNYLETAVSLTAGFQFLGAIGGTILAEFESKFPEDLPPPFAMALATGTVDRARWSNDYFDGNSQPYGAGICVRRTVATAYLENCNHPAKRGLGRAGTGLGGCDDTEIVFTAIDLGLGTGRFPELILTHLIGKKRLAKEYLMRIIEEGTASRVLLEFVRWGRRPHKKPKRDHLKFWMDYWANSPGYRRLMLAVENGRRRGLKLIAEMEAKASTTK